MPGYDRISELPDSLLTQILSCFPTKDLVKTSVLSTRWKNLWLSFPRLDLDCSFFPYGEDEVFLSFLDKFLEFNPELRLSRVKIKCRDLAIKGLRDRISKAINRGVQYLDVESSFHYLEDGTDIYPFIEYMPLNLYTSNTLVSLKLSYTGLEDPSSVSLPCLKFMHLIEVHWRSNSNLEKLLSGCPVLEELTLLRNMHDDFEGTDGEIMRVRSRSLKRFYIPSLQKYFEMRSVKCALEIDAPGLEYMSLREDHFDRIVVKNLSSLVSIVFGIKFIIASYFYYYLDPEGLIRDFLSGISSVKHMTVSEISTRALHSYSEAGIIPKFNNLSRLQVTFPCDLLQFLPAYLESCPNLNHLIMNVVYERDMEEFKLKKVPHCFLTTLEFVEMRGISEWGEDELKVASYFLENAEVLKKLVVSLVNYPRAVTDSEIYKELNKVAKRSRSCNVLSLTVKPIDGSHGMSSS